MSKNTSWLDKIINIFFKSRIAKQDTEAQRTIEEYKQEQSESKKDQELKNQEEHKFFLQQSARTDCGALATQGKIAILPDSTNVTDWSIPTYVNTHFLEKYRRLLDKASQKANVVQGSLWDEVNATFKYGTWKDKFDRAITNISINEKKEDIHTKMKKRLSTAANARGYLLNLEMAVKQEFSKNWEDQRPKDPVQNEVSPQLEDKNEYRARKNTFDSIVKSNENLDEEVEVGWWNRLSELVSHDLKNAHLNLNSHFWETVSGTLLTALPILIVEAAVITSSLVDTSGISVVGLVISASLSYYGFAAYAGYSGHHKVKEVIIMKYSKWLAWAFSIVANFFVLATLRQYTNQQAVDVGLGQMPFYLAGPFLPTVGQVKLGLGSCFSLALVFIFLPLTVTMKWYDLQKNIVEEKKQYTYLIGARKSYINFKEISKIRVWFDAYMSEKIIELTYSDLFLHGSLPSAQHYKNVLFQYPTVLKEIIEKNLGQFRADVSPLLADFMTYKAAFIEHQVNAAWIFDHVDKNRKDATNNIHPRLKYTVNSSDLDQMIEAISPDLSENFGKVIMPQAAVDKLLEDAKQKCTKELDAWETDSAKQTIGNAEARQKKLADEWDVCLKQIEEVFTDQYPVIEGERVVAMTYELKTEILQQLVISISANIEAGFQFPTRLEILRGGGSRPIQIPKQLTFGIADAKKEIYDKLVVTEENGVVENG